MALEKFCSWPSETLPSNLYWPSVTHKLQNRCVSSVCVNYDKMLIFPVRSYWFYFLGPFILCCNNMVHKSILKTRDVIDTKNTLLGLVYIWVDYQLEKVKYILPKHIQDRNKI